jgi:5'-deoxynucleotidase YfbR-like HD superfamily hydrolase
MAKKIVFTDIHKLVQKAVLPFYEIERDLSIPPPGRRRRENDAEHSWSLALVACALAPHVDKKLDVGKICQFAVIHDLTELYAGDTSVVAPQEEHQTKAEREHQAFQIIEKEFAQFPWLTQTLKEYERQDTPEAHFVRSVDKTISLYILYLDEARHDRDNQLTLEEFVELFEHQRQKARIHPGAFVYYEEIHAAIRSHPEFFFRGQKS